MSVQTEQRGFAVGRGLGTCGRWTRFVLGLLGLVSLGMSVARPGPSATLIGQITISLLLTAAFYLALFWLLGERVPHPWLRTVIFWFPAAFILWGLGVLLYWSVACLVTALTAYGGGAGGGVPQPPLSAQYTVYCPLNAIDLFERRYTQR